MTHSIALVQANDIIGNNVRLPLAIGVLWQQAMTSTLNSNKWELEKIVHAKLPVNETAQQLSHCDVVAFSCYVWNFEYHMQLAQAIKKINPTCFVVVGGPQIHTGFVDFWPAWGHCIDFALLGEGDNSFCQLLEQWPAQQSSAIPGAWTKDWCQGEAPRTENLTTLPSPYLNGFYDSIIQEETAKGHYIEAVLQTNRGCPYHCTFCEEGKEYKNKMFFYDEKQIRQEIEWFGINKIEMVDIADDNWGIADRDVDLMQYICETKLKYGYPNVLDATYAKNAPDRLWAIAKIDHRFGTKLIRGITFAYQSNNTETLSAIKRFNLVPDKQYQLIKKLKSIGTPTYVEMIWPLPYETYQTFCQGIDDTIDLGLDTWLQVYTLGMSPSTDLYDDFVNSYDLAASKSNQSFIPAFATPVSNKWVTNETMIQGQVFYTWLAVLYYFGFARPVLEWFKLSKGQTITQTVDKFIEFAGSDTTLCAYKEKINNYWQQSILKQPLPDIGMFKNSTDFWQPYTHLASWLQHDHDNFIVSVGEFLESQQLDTSDISRLTEKLKHCIVKFSHSDADKFFNFCQQYYFYKRKSGASYVSP